MGSRKIATREAEAERLLSSASTGSFLLESTNFSKKHLILFNSQKVVSLMSFTETTFAISVRKNKILITLLLSTFTRASLKYFFFYSTREFFPNVLKDKRQSRNEARTSQLNFDFDSTGSFNIVYGEELRKS